MRCRSGKIFEKSLRFLFFGGSLRRVDAFLDTLGATMTTAVQFLHTFNFLLSHGVSPEWISNPRKYTDEIVWCKGKNGFYRYKSRVACESGLTFQRALGLMLPMRKSWIILFSALGLMLGMANPWVQIPVLVLLYPAGLAWIGFEASNRAEAFRLGWLTGLIGATGVLYWVALPVQEFGGLPWPLAAACAMGIAAYVGVYGGLFALAARQWCCGNVWVRAILLGAVWYVLEWVRGWFMTGFPWMPLAAAFVPWPAAIQSAAFVGAYGLGGVLASKAVLICIAVRERRWEPGIMAVALLLCMLAGGLWRLSQNVPAGPELDVLLVQGNVDQNVKWDPERQRATTDRYLSLTESGLANMERTDGVPRLVIWPETAMPYDFETAPFTDTVRDFVRREGVFLMTGSVGWEPLAMKYLNRAYLLGPNADPLRWYEKEHLVPFGEYVPPGLDMAFLQAFMQGVGDFVPGTRTEPLPLHPGTGQGQDRTLVPGVLICYETIFPELARKHVAGGADLLINISNDAWFGRTSAPEQHLQLSVLRAVEQGKPLVRGTNTGISAFVDSRGRVLEHGRLFRAETLSMRVQTSRETTLFYFLAPILPGLGLVLWLVMAYVLKRIGHVKRP